MQNEAGLARILIVEGDKDTAAMLRVLLEPRGYTIRIAYDGLSGLASAQAEPFSLIILDLELTGMKGDEVVTHLRQDKRTADVPVLVLTGQTDGSKRVRLFELGVDEYLTRPVSPLELLSRIQGLLRRSSDMQLEPTGKRIVFLGCAGGVGTSTLCANVAQALGSRAATVVVDAAWPLGTLTHLLAVPPQPGLRQLVGQRMAPDILNRYLAGGHAGLRFRYLNGYDAISSNGGTKVDVEQILESACALAKYVLVDVGDGSAPFASEIVRHADIAVIVMALERTHITQMRSYVDFLDGLGLRRSRRILVGNRLRPSPFGIRETQRYLDEHIFLIIPYEGDRLAQCLAEGRLLLTQFPSSAGAIAIAELASALNRQSAVEA
jgi:CheY-like chemotaxis protein/MinD-like ATPase involved in chromosome partitioning or flagellar assembly